MRKSNSPSTGMISSSRLGGEIASSRPSAGTSLTNHDTLGYYDYLAFDLKDGKDLQIEANDIPGNTSQELVRTSEANSTKPNWKVVYRDGTSEIFPGIVTDIETDPSDMKGKVVFRFTLKIAGAVVRTNAS